MTRDSSQARDDRKELHDKILQSLGPYTEKSTFLGLLPMTNQDENISKITPIDCYDPKWCWIFQDIDFKDWESTNGVQVLWLIGSPDREITKVSSHIVGQAKENSSGVVYYFFCSMLEWGTLVATTFSNSILRHILEISDDCQAKSIITAFLSTLLHNILERDQSRFREDTSLIKTVEEILNASGGELLGALTTAVDQINKTQETSIIIDRVDELGKEGAQFLKKFCSHMETIINPGPKLKVLLTCRQGPHIKEIVDGVPCIEYDKERQDCLNSLRYDDTRYDKVSKEHKGSLEWLWDHENYRKWSSSESSSLLYIEGKPGSGKSTLAKYFRENLAEKEPKATSGIIVNYFYTQRGTILEPTHENMLR
ncbi:hypothetical protein BDD12DRAFT_809535 [Trichophaea hybrida]|nr:hypothetical protein BDD12DRAFT_809535 [Trichophaea hybrida]